MDVLYELDIAAATVACHFSTVAILGIVSKAVNLLTPPAVNIVNYDFSYCIYLKPWEFNLCKILSKKSILFPG